MKFDSGCQLYIMTILSHVYVKNTSLYRTILLYYTCSTASNQVNITLIKHFQNVKDGIDINPTFSDYFLHL